MPRLVSNIQQQSLTELIRQAEQAIFEGLQRFPGDQFLLALESDLGKVLDDHARAVEALKRAFEASPGRSFVAVRFARYHAQRGDIQLAMDILKRSIAANPVGKETPSGAGQLCIAQDEERLKDEIAYQLNRSFTPGDSNLDAQFWHARHTFLHGDKDIALAAFRQLAKAESTTRL